MYCANDPCENEAEYVIVETNTPLCGTCREAYKWGQAFPEKTVGYIHEWYDENAESNA